MPNQSRSRRRQRRARVPVDECDDEEPQLRIIKPEEQLQDLTERQLEEEKTISLDAQNPNLPQKLVFFNCNKGQYVADDREMSHLIVHFEMESQIQHVKSEEKAEDASQVAELTEEEAGQEEEEVQPQEGEAEPCPDQKEPEKPQQRKPQLRNQFKYSERGSQTFNQPMRDRAVETVPPDVRDYSDCVTRAMIFDAYVDEFSMKQDEVKKPKSKPRHQTENPSAIRMLHSDSLRHAVKQMEYVVHHNSEYEVYNDFKFWQGEKKGEMNHLWRIKSNIRRCVTSIIFNKQFPEMFVVGMGSYDFNKPAPGTVSLYTIKNPTHPESSFDTPSGVMCMDFSADKPSLLCVGFYNGSVAVYDIRKSCSPCIYYIESPEDYHTDPVWEVRWVAGEMAFLSVSTDGHINKWILSKNELTKENILVLKRDDTVADDEGLLRTAQATTFDLSPVNPNECLVGTEFGEIYLYDLTKENQTPKTFDGHDNHVYAVRWSPFNCNTFISGSEDWSLKLWDTKQSNPICSFDLMAPVGDICWSKYSSTSFSAVTFDNRIHVFDLAVNKNAASIRHNTNSKKYALTKVSCAAEAPIIVTGNKFGVLDIFKLPEYLTIHSSDRTEEQERLEKVLKITGSNVLDLNGMKLPRQLQG